MLDRFNNDPLNPMVLITTGGVGGVGLNAQKMCWNVHILETPFNDAMRIQEIGRVRRIGSPRECVKVYEYFIPGTYDSVQMYKQISKAIPEAIAMLNADAGNGGESKKDLMLEEWVVFEGKLSKVADLRQRGVPPRSIPPAMTAEMLVRQLLTEMRGQQKSIR